MVKVMSIFGPLEPLLYIIIHIFASYRPSSQSDWKICRYKGKVVQKSLVSFVNFPVWDKYRNQSQSEKKQPQSMLWLIGHKFIYFFLHLASEGFCQFHDRQVQVAATCTHTSAFMCLRHCPYQSEWEWTRMSNDGSRHLWLFNGKKPPINQK